MEWIVIIGLGVALYQLWRRVEGLERRLADREAREAIRPNRGPVAEEKRTPPEEPESAPRPAIARVVGAATRFTVPTAKRPVQASEPARGRSISLNFEELFGRQLPIWAGGITLAIAGFYLVIYAIDLGLLSPTVRVLLGFAFGGLLLQSAFVAEKMKERVADPRVPQALAGAGLATLYACFYLAGQQYGLIGGGVAFAGLAAVTAVAVWLSYRFGLPCAVLGLVGGFAAPTLVASDQANLPILSIYLALVSAGLTLTGNRQDRPWLGIAALVGGLLWGVTMLFSQDLSIVDQAFIGAYLVVIGVVMPAGIGDTPWRRWLRAGAGAFAALQMAVLVDNGGFTLLAWGLYGLLSAALAFLAWREKHLRDASALTAAIGLWLLMFWPNPAEVEFAVVAAGLAAIFALVPLAHVWRGDDRTSDVVQLSGFAPGLALATMWQFGDVFNFWHPVVAAAALALATLPTLAAWRMGERAGWKGHLLEVSAALATVCAFAQLMHDDWPAIACAASAIVLALALPRRVAGARTFAAIAAAFAVYPLGVWLKSGLEAVVGEPLMLSDLVNWQDTARYLVPGVIAGIVLAWQQAGAGKAFVTQGVAFVAGIGAIVAAHSFYKLAFAIDNMTVFTQTGLAERSIWEALLLAAAFAAWRLEERLHHGREIALGLTVAALAHFTWFTLGLHNPLWDAQVVGAVPVANLVLAAYAVALGGLVLLRRLLREDLRIGVDIALMALIPMLMLTLLRQGFSGSLLIAVPMGQAEDLLRSLSGIVLAIGYLLWGARREDRAWRVGSLVLMLLAVGKVFLVDAAGLEGLARIASFMALGFSLIGIGWFYTRLLARPAVQPAG